MKVEVLLFAGARDRVGKGRVELRLGEGSRVADILSDPVLAALGPHKSALRYAVNEEFVAADAPVKDGDIVAVLPPVSGG